MTWSYKVHDVEDYLFSDTCCEKSENSQEGILSDYGLIERMMPVLNASCDVQVTAI